MQTSGTPRTKSIRAVLLLAFLVNFGVALNAYINSTFLTGAIGDKNVVSALFTAGSLLAIIGLAFIPLALRRIGNYRMTLVVTLGCALFLASLALLGNPVATSLAFLGYFALMSIVYYHLDLLLEHFSRNETTGAVRGGYLTVSNLAFLAGPFVAGFVLRSGSYEHLYLLSALLFLTALPILVRSFRTYEDPAYIRAPFWKTLASIVRHPDMRGIFSAFFLLRFFYAWMVIYTPIYLNEYIGLSWSTIGIVFTVMLLPFVLLQYPLGKIADTKLGEKEIMAGGFLIMAGTTAALTLITTGTWWVWALALFATRVGASMVEDMSSIYFFKKTDERHAELVSFFQMVSPLSYVLGPLIASLVLALVDFRFIFVVLGVIMLTGVGVALRLKDTL